MATSPPVTLTQDQLKDLINAAKGGDKTAPSALPDATKLKEIMIAKEWVLI